MRRLDGYARRPGRKTILEMYHAIPANAPTPADGKREWTREPFEWEELESQDFIDCAISDHGIPTRLDDSVLPELYSAVDSMVPHPLTLFLRTGREGDLHRWVMFPERRAPAPAPPSPDMHKSAASHARTFGTWHYRFDHIHETILAKNGSGADGAEPRAHRALPGSLRSIIYTVPKEDISDAPPVRAVGRQWCRHSQSLAAAMPLFEEQAENGVQDTPNTFAWVDLPGALDGEDVGCMLWDETIGRLFLASKTLEEVYVLDFAKQPRLGEWRAASGLCLGCGMLIVRVVLQGECSSARAPFRSRSHPTQTRSSRPSLRPDPSHPLRVLTLPLFLSTPQITTLPCKPHERSASPMTAPSRTSSLPVC